MVVPKAILRNYFQNYYLLLLLWINVTLISMEFQWRSKFKITTTHVVILLKGSLYYRKSRGDRYITRQNVPWIKTRNVINEMGYRLHLYIEWQRVNEPRSIAGLISAQWNQSLEHFPLGSRNTVRWVGVVLSRIFVERYQRPTIQHWSVASFQITL